MRTIKLKVQLDGARSGQWNMDRDRELLSSHRPGDDPILRIYRWQPAAVTIGYNQKFDDFDEAKIGARGYDLVQRPTGGRAILHADELTYAIVGTSAAGVPAPVFGNSLHSTYTKINAALLLFLQELGLEADISSGESRVNQRSLVCFNSAGKYEVQVGGRKIIGSAQRRKNAVFLQHGSILTGPRHLDLTALLGSAATTSSDVLSLADATTDLGQLLGTKQTEACLENHTRHLADCFCRVLELERSSAPESS